MIVHNLCFYVIAQFLCSRDTMPPIRAKGKRTIRLLFNCNRIIRAVISPRRRPKDWIAPEFFVRRAFAHALLYLRKMRSKLHVILAIITMVIPEIRVGSIHSGNGTCRQCFLIGLKLLFSLPLFGIEFGVGGAVQRLPFGISFINRLVLRPITRSCEIITQASTRCSFR